MHKRRRIVSLAMALILMLSMVGVVPISHAETLTDKYEVLDLNARTDLAKNEIVTAEDLNILIGSSFDPEDVHDGITADEEAVKVTYDETSSNLDLEKPGTYETYYLVRPKSEKTPYLICRHIRVYEEEDVGSESSEEGGDSPETKNNIGEERSDSEAPLSLGEITSIQSADAVFTISLDEKVAGTQGVICERNEEVKEKNGVLDTIGGALKGIADFVFPSKPAKAASDKLKVGYSGYVKYCGRSMGYKYIVTEGDYYHHLVYCMNVGKNTTNGTVESGKHVPAKITFCLVNGAYKKGELCRTSKYSSNAADKDYFITSAAIHVLNGEVKLSYYNDGSGVYKNIKQMVDDAKHLDKTEYNTQTGATKTVSYSISPKSSKWKKISDDLYRSENKFVRTKEGAIKNISYKITDAPSGLTTGEIAKDSSDISDADDLKKYDICVAQTDKDKPSANFYVYATKDAYDQIVAKNKTIKVTAKVKADEKVGRVWTPTVVSQQKITFLEKIEVTNITKSVKITFDEPEKGSLLVKKTSTYDNTAVDGAEYGLYEDFECEDLLCILTKDPEAGGLYATGIEDLTQDTYYLKEISNPEGFILDETVYEIDRSYFHIEDASGHVIQAGKQFNHKEEPERVSVMIIKKDKDSGSIVKNAKFAIFDDAACTKRTKIDRVSEPVDVPYLTYDEDLDGYVSERFKKEQENYYIKEVDVPTGYVNTGQVYTFQPDFGDMFVIDVDNVAIKCELNAEKFDKETSQMNQGDATLSGAVYGLYCESDIQLPDGSGYMKGSQITCTKGDGVEFYDVDARAGTLLATVKTDETHKFGFKDLYFGDYYIQEITPSTGYLLNETRYPVKFTEKGSTSQTIAIGQDVEDTVIKQAFELIKISSNGESTEVSKVEGAEFTVKLKSEIDRVGWEQAKVYDVLVSDSKGFARSKELPYGEYLVRETKVPNELDKTKDFTVTVREDSRTPQVWRIFNDAPFEAYIKLIKKDIETGETVLLSGVTFKIRKIGEEGFVEQKLGDKKISEFITDETGTVTTPLKLKFGEYEATEFKAPDGYLINTAAKPFSVTKEGAVQVKEDSDGDAVIEVEIQNQAVKGKVIIHKLGERLAGTTYDTIFDRILTGITGDDRSVKFNYESAPLKGAVFDLIADENIYSADHAKDENGDRKLAIYNGKPLKMGEVAATVTTDDAGDAVIDGLPLGKYHLVEKEAPKGFVPPDETFSFDLKYKDDHTAVIESDAKVENIRQKLQLRLVKTEAAVSGSAAMVEITKQPDAASGSSASLEPSQASTGSAVSIYNESTVGTPVEGATYGIYTMEDIKDHAGNILVAAGTLIESEKTDADGVIEFTADLPLGKYYVKEIETAPGYLRDEGEYGIDFSDPDPTIKIVKREIKVADFPTIVQVSKQDITTASEIPDATLQIFDHDDELFAEWTTDGNPYTISAMPPGDYTMIETAAPYGYMIQNAVEFTVTETGDIQHVTMVDERVPGILEIIKTDRETKKALKGVEFTLFDEKGKEVEKLVTDEDGVAKSSELPIGSYKENGEFDKPFTYTVKETKALDGYIPCEATFDVRFEYDDSAIEPVVSHLSVTNQPTEPPLTQTGGNHMIWLGALIIGAIAGIAVFLRKRRKIGGK